MANSISWMHPSYRDLVIEELIDNATMRTNFIKSATIRGIKLAISDTGGESGNRNLPLMVGNEDWETLQTRATYIALNGTRFEQLDLLTALSNATSREIDINIIKKLSKIISLVCEATKNSWHSKDTVVNSIELTTYCQASLFTNPLAPLPDLSFSWEHKTRAALEEISAFEESPSVSKVDEWIDFAVAIKNNEPRFLKRVNFPAAFSDSIHKFSALIQEYTKWELLNPSRNEVFLEIETLEKMKECVGKFLDFPFLNRRLLRLAINNIDQKIESMKEIAEEISEKLSEKLSDEMYEKYDPELYRDDINSRLFDVDVLFSDL